MEPQIKHNFVMKEPIPRGFLFFDVIISPDYHNFIANFPGVERVRHYPPEHYSPDYVSVRVDPRYDVDEVWLSLWYALEAEIEAARLWGGALEEVEK